MKKTLLAAALTLGFAGVAQAETSVTLYGIIDTGIAYQQTKGNSSYLEGRTDATDFKNTRTGVLDGGSTGQYGNRWGLKGVEDLGNGLRAVFVLESGFDIGTGHQGQGGRLFGRQATLGLASDSWGQLDLGRQTNIASKYLPGVADAFGASYGQANFGSSFTAANTVRYDNMVMYQTPNFSGFQFGVGYSFNADGPQRNKVSGSDDSNNRAVTTGIRYANGPIGVALTYDQVKNPSTAAGFDVDGFLDGLADGVIPATLDPVPAREGTTARAWNLGGSYDFEVVKVFAAFGQSRNGLIGSQTYAQTFATPAAFRSVLGEGFKANSYAVGLSAPIGNGTLMASWQMMDPRAASDAYDDARAAAGEAYDLESQHTYSIGYNYGLSKRTSVYAIGSYSDHVAFLPDAKSTVVGVGINHKF